MFGVLAAVLVLALTSTAQAEGTRANHSACWPYHKCPTFPTPFAGSGYPNKYSYTGSFPKGFIWGLGTAAYQIEGAYNEDGRGASIWDTFTGANTVGMPGSTCTSAPCPVNSGMFAKGATGNVANDHYHRYKDDVALMQSLGLKYYRFSISWPRLVPLGNASAPGAVNEKAVDFYNDLIDTLLAAQITPVVTLYHWDLPQALLQPPYDEPRKMGWFAASSDGKPAGEDTIVDLFAKYSDLCFARFGDRVKMWVTFNEAWTFTWLGSGGGKAPGLAEFAEMPKWPLIAGHNVLLAHAAAVSVYRTKYSDGVYAGGSISMTNNMDWKEPRSTNQRDVTAAQRALEFQLAWYADPIFTGDYPESMKAILGDMLPQFTNQQKQMLKGSSDFFMLNSYGSGWAYDSDSPGFCSCYCATDETAGPDGPAFPRAQSIWLYAAGWGIRKLTNWITHRYGRVPIIITEAGWSLAANNATAGAVDPQRTSYFANYTSSLRDAIYDDNVNIQGFFGWSLMDNFEWERGYTERFGVVFNDFDFGPDPDSPPGPSSTPRAANQARTPKDTSRWLSQVWSKNALVPPF